MKFRESFEFEKSDLYKKSLVISKLCEQIAVVCKNYEGDNREVILELSNQIQEDSMMISVKIAGAWAAELYDLKMENAALIRKSAKDIILATTGLMHWGLEENKDYLLLIKAELEEFRILFAEWVKSFDPETYVIDRWGVFNPPGVNYDDKDPDDDLFE